MKKNARIILAALSLIAITLADEAVHIKDSGESPTIRNRFFQ